MMLFLRLYNDGFVYASFFMTILLVVLMIQIEIGPFVKKPIDPRQFMEINKSLHKEPTPVAISIAEEIGANNKTDMDELIQLILYRQKDIIDASLRNYKYHPSLHADSYEDLQLVYGGKPVRNMIVTTWRSGSTFLGDLMLSHPASYYHYEPLLPYGINTIRNEPLSTAAIRDLKKLMDCDYSNMNHFFDFAKKFKFLLEHNFPLWNICKEFQSLCFNPSFVSSMCKLFPFQVIKTVRLQVALAEEFLRNKTAQVLLLVRDPRGTIQSRHHRIWCPDNPDCSDPRRLCSDLVQDYNAAKKLIKKYPNTFRVIRYEDLSLDIYNKSTVLFDFFRLNYDPQVKNFLDTHTTQHKGGVSSTFRNSKTAPIHWRFDLIWEEVTFIQNICEEALHLWGYELASDRQHLKTFNPIGPFSFPT